MNKKLRYGLLTLLAFMGLAVSAQTTFDFDNDYATLFPDVVFDSDGNGYISGNDAVSIEKDGFTITVSVGDNPDKNANCIWNKSPRLRIYSGTITISGSGIKTIQFIHGGSFNLSLTDTSKGEKIGNVWTGNEDEVVFACGNTSTQLKQIIINAEIPPVVPIEVSIAQFLNKEDSEDDWYQLTGTVGEVKNSQYGNFYLEDSSGSVYVYGLSEEKGGQQNGSFTKLGIEPGDILTIIGNRYTHVKDGVETDEVTNAYFVDVEKGEAPEIIDISVEDFLDEPVSTDVWYRLKGKITNLKDGDQYGNFDLVDETGSVYVYGVLSEKGGEKKKFQELVGKYGIKNGGYITIIGNRGYYAAKDQIQVANAYFEDYEDGADPKTYTVTVEEALEAAVELDKNATSFDFYKVTGYVVGTPVYKRSSSTGELYGDVNLYIADEINGTPTFYIYQANNKDNELFTESDLNLFTAGDKVTFLGKLKNYVRKDKETGEEADPVYELVEGYLLNYEVSPTVTVTIPSSGLATFCPARPILVEDDQEVYIAKELQEDKVIVERVSGKIAANVGLLIKGEESVTFDVEERGEEPEDNLLVGVLDPTDLEEGEAYILVDGSFHPCNAGTFPAGKAYLPAEAVSGAKVIVFGGETTSINEMKAQDSSSEIYTIGGIRVKNAQQKGVYIINGKKVVK